MPRARSLGAWCALALFAVAPVWGPSSGAALPPPGTDTISESTALVTLELLGRQAETLGFRGPTVV